MTPVTDIDGVKLTFGCHYDWINIYYNTDTWQEATVVFNKLKKKYPKIDFRMNQGHEMTKYDKTGSYPIGNYWFNSVYFSLYDLGKLIEL